MIYCSECKKCVGTTENLEDVEIPKCAECKLDTIR
jgi:hypothetical protein